MALFGYNYLGCITIMPGASCIPSLFLAPCDGMLAMLVCATRWLSMHLYTLAHSSMHESCLLVCRPCFNTLKLWIFDANLHLSLTDTIFCLFPYLFAFFAHLLAFLLCLLCLSCLSALCLFHIPFASFPSIACLLFFCLCLCLCMYTHGVRTLGARA